MLRNNLKFFVRIFLKDKFYSMLNILGLALGIAVSIVLLLILQNDLTYDQHSFPCWGSLGSPLLLPRSAPKRSASVKCMAPSLSREIKKPKGKQERIFELRTYHCLPGKLEDLDMRFRDHTRKLFEKHGMANVVYWHTVPQDGTQPKLVYLLAHKNEAAAKASFDAFRNDAEWVKARDASEANGKIVEKVESVYLAPLAFSPLK